MVQSVAFYLLSTTALLDILTLLINVCTAYLRYKTRQYASKINPLAHNVARDPFRCQNQILIIIDMTLNISPSL